MIRPVEIGHRHADRGVLERRPESFVGLTQFGDVVEVADDAADIGVVDVVGDGGLEMPPAALSVLTPQDCAQHLRGSAKSGGNSSANRARSSGCMNVPMRLVLVASRPSRPRIRSNAGLTYCMPPVWSVTTMMSAALETRALKRRSD